MPRPPADPCGTGHQHPGQLGPFAVRPLDRPRFAHRAPKKRLHLYAGALVAPFPLTAAVTGPLYAGSIQAERLVYGHEPTVPAGERALPRFRPGDRRPQGPPGGHRHGRPPRARGRRRALGLHRTVAVDPAAGRVTDELRFADHPVLAELTRWGIDLHTGVLFEVPPYLLAPPLGIPPACFLVVGILLGEVANRRGRRTCGSVSGVK
ncbi:PepSY domain-containing protein [Streptomyces olivaceoviridis]|uniref:PepSY domain-containing protein n=1 Tax=Streptomyces olivaceoviridis TaxID=1921 RepID=UPI003792071E